jgi:hypothetical protein
MRWTEIGRRAKRASVTSRRIELANAWRRCVGHVETLPAILCVTIIDLDDSYQGAPEFGMLSHTRTRPHEWKVGAIRGARASSR